MTKLTTEITIEELQYRIHAHENDLTQMWTADYFLNVQKELLALKQAAKNPVAWVATDSEDFPEYNSHNEFSAGCGVGTPLYAAPVLPKQPDSQLEVSLHRATQDQIAAVMLRCGTPKQVSAALQYAHAQPVIPEQPQAELKIGTSKNAWPYYVAQCPKCGWLGSSADCLGDEESCDCPLCYADADEVDAETAFNVMLSAINELRASTAQPVSEPYKLPELNDELIEILGRPNFTCAKLAECLRNCGQDIKRKSEYEQAAVLHVLLNLYIKHGNDWRKHAQEAFTPSPAQESE